MNKIGMNLLLWGVEINSSHIPIFEMLSKAGFDGIEIPVVGQDEKEIIAMREAAASLNLECTAATFVTPDVNPIDPAPEIRKAALVSMKQRIDETAMLGADILVGGIYQAHKYFVGRGATQQEWDWSVDFLQRAGEYAKTLNVRLGLEFLNRFEVFLLNTSADARRMALDIGLDNVGVLYDTHHANIEDPAPSIALASLEDSLMHVHLSESHRGTLGSGQVNWLENFKAIKEADYNGWLVIEAFGSSVPDIVGAANIWRDAFDSEQQLATDGLAFIKSNAL